MDPTDALGIAPEPVRLQDLLERRPVPFLPELSGPCWSTRISRFMRLAASSAGAANPVPPVRRTPPLVHSQSPSGDLAARRIRLVVLWILSKPRTSVL